MNRYQKPQNMNQQIELYSSNYMRHGNKEERRRKVQRLRKAVDEIGREFRIKDVRQIGKRQVIWFDYRLHELKRSSATRTKYWYSWKLLWEWLERLGEPPRPKLTPDDSVMY